MGYTPAEILTQRIKNMKNTIEIMNQIITTSQIEAKRGKTALAVDRLRQAASEATLLKCINRFFELMQSDMQYIRHDAYLEFMRSASSENANGILRSIRIEPAMFIMAATLKNPEERAEVSALIPIPPAGTGGSIGKSPSYDLPIAVKMLSPLAHGADNKSGNATLFRRQQVIAENGSVLNLPYYDGNAFRGVLRDILADHFISALGLNPRRDTPPIALWFFYVLYSGGALEENSKAQKILTSKLGANGTVNSDGIYHFRNMLPAISALGAALGGRIISGRIKVGALRPLCIEWGNGDIPASELMDWSYLTRREKCENAEENHSMIAMTEVLKAGTELTGGIDFAHASDLEKSAVATGLELMRDIGIIGAESRRGYGKIEMSFENLPDSSLYKKFLNEKQKDIFSYLNEIEAFAKEKVKPKEEQEKKIDMIAKDQVEGLF